MPHVLVVEDDKNSRDAVASYLKREGHRVTTAEDGETALRELINQPADVIVLDVRMSTMNGIELLELLRSYRRWNRLPVILVTGNADPGEMRQARDLGVDYIFHKAGFQLLELGKAIEAVCRLPADGNDTQAS